MLYEATFEERWYVEAVALADAMIERFGDPERGGFFTTAADVPHLVSRRKDLEDAPIPSGNSAAALGLLRLARLSGDAAYEQPAARRARAARAARRCAIRPPSAICCRRSTSTWQPLREVAIVGAGPLTGALRTRSGPTSRSPGPTATAPTAPRCRCCESRTTVDGRQAAYVCERFACRLPVTELAALEALL